MRRKKDDKRVLRSGNGRQNASPRKIRRIKNRNSYNNRQFLPGRPVNRKNKKKRKASGGVVLIMIIALVAFVIGAGIGVSLSFDDGSDEGPRFENVTEEMTAGLNETQPISYDKEVDAIDFNENVTSQFDVNYTNNEESQ
nr:hypothetical protein [uncultured Methanobrevibacter sp.]